MTTKVWRIERMSDAEFRQVFLPAAKPKFDFSELRKAQRATDPEPSGYTMKEMLRMMRERMGQNG